jgi:predicted GNAT superfamily acetyltransferase
MGDQIIIRQIEHYHDVLECESIQQAAWSMSSPRDIIPAHILNPITRHGGLLLGAYDGSKLIGFVFGFVGWQSNLHSLWGNIERYHCSEMMGVLPEYWSQSIGYRLKLAQRTWLLDHGYKLAIWTFDPLLSRNAWLNFQKLGVICRTYIRDAYGEMSGLYAGLPTDRFEVEWWIDSPRTKQHIENPIVHSMADWIAESAVLFASKNAPYAPITKLTGESKIIVEIPSDIQAVKTENFELAKQWRIYTRELFESLYSQGYATIGFTSDGATQRSYYLLSNQYNLSEFQGT